MIYIVTDCFNRIFDYSIRVSRSFYKVGGRALQAFGRAWVLPGVPLDTPLFETNVSHVSHASDMLVSNNYSYFMLVHSL